MKLKLLVIFLIFTFLLTTGISCGGPTAKKEPLKNVELKIWSVFDTDDNFKTILEAYKISRPNVKISYSKLRWEDYEKKVLEAWAEGAGPDIFVVHNTWLGKYQNKILPLPTKLKLPVIETSGFFKQKKNAVLKEFSTLTAYEVKNLFPDIVYNDIVKNDQIFGLPLSIDTLALFYNREHLNAAGITTPPATWEEVVTATKKLTLKDAAGKILRSAIALGGSQNINRSIDVLSLLMLQNGATMMSAQGRSTFQQNADYNNKIKPGEQALKFYTDFALPFTEVYTWQTGTSTREALEAFSAGELAMLLDYSYQIPTIRAQSPNIDFGIAPAPHLNSNGTDVFNLPINFASYWNYSVFKQSANPNEAWDFIVFMTTKKYTDKSGQTRYYAEDYLDSSLAKQSPKPPALRALINKYKNTQSDVSVFTDQILTAQSWYRGQNPESMQQAFKNLVDYVIEGKMTTAQALSWAAKVIDQTYLVK